MKKIFDIFKIKKEERWLALSIFLALAVRAGVSDIRSSVTAKTKRLA